MTTSPSFKITGIHIRGLRGLQELDLPENGLGWKSGFPDIAVIGGANGSGKTTLLRCLTRAAQLLLVSEPEVPKEVAAAECQLDFVLSDGGRAPEHVRFLVGSEEFVEANAGNSCYGYIVPCSSAMGTRHEHDIPSGRGESGRGSGDGGGTSDGSGFGYGSGSGGGYSDGSGDSHDNEVVTRAPIRTLRRGAVVSLSKSLRGLKRFTESTWPRLAFFPSEDRDLVVPLVRYKAPGQLEDTAGFVAWWTRTGEKQWSGSTLELLFSARWADLNANEKGRPEAATHFERFTKAFADLTASRKRLEWTVKGDLVVELQEGGTHPVQDLSSGERQALLLLAELRRLWRPGSLILIDELELHLHDAWQGQLYEALLGMQQELGGQVIITTQSHSLFEMAESGTQALLGRTGLR